jgi:Tol biopolymer transport system component/DNA-binding winged helix-turn-helix (wHTH) protein
MADTDSLPRPIRFQDFELDLRAGELRKAGVKLKVTGQPLLVLAALLERPGEVVTRDELQKKLWPDTFVDVDHNLNTAINKIREALGDSAESPRFVETVPRRGYRFIGAIPAPIPALVARETPPVSRSHRNRAKIWAVILTILVLSAGGFACLRWLQHKTSEEHEVDMASLTPVPFTALPGAETSPAFSPDGSRIAFAWNGDPVSSGKGFDLYVKAIGSETMLRLTQQPSDLLSPAWSPDGTQIAFHRVSGAATGLYVVPALGGPERKIRSTRISWSHFTGLAGNNNALISWSPDGKWIAYADGAPGEHTRIHLLSMETLDARPIPLVPDCMSQVLPAFSHDGMNLAYWCILPENDASLLYVSPIEGGQPRKVSTIRDFPNGLTWSADDRRLIYSHYSFEEKTELELNEVAVANGSTEKLSFAGSGMLPTVSPKGDKLAYSSLLFLTLSIWRRELLHPESQPIELVPSSRTQYDGQYAPDGKRIAFTSVRSGVQGVWISSADGSNLVQLSNPHDQSGSPQWSPDGSRIVFDSIPKDRWEIFVAEVSQGKARKVATNVPDVIRPHWSRDGKWIYFSSNDPGRRGIYRCPAEGGDAIALSRDIRGVSAQESFDGKTIYFASNAPETTLKQLAVSAQPGSESEVEGLPHLNGSNLWALAQGGIYFVPTEAARSVRYFDFRSKQIRKVIDVDRELGSLSISPDGRWMIYTKIGDVTSDIILAEHFH